MENIIRSVYQLLNILIVSEVSPYHFQIRSCKFLHFFSIYFRRSCKCTDFEAISPRQELFQSLLSHRTCHSCNCHDFLWFCHICMYLRIVKCQCCIKRFPDCIQCSSCHGGISDYHIACTDCPCALFNLFSASGFGADCHHCIITRVLYFCSILLSDNLSFFNSSYGYFCNGFNSCQSNTFHHTGFPCHTHIRTVFLHHFQIRNLTSSLCQIFGYFHTDHTAADDNHISADVHLSVQDIVRIYHTRKVCSRDSRNQRFCADCIEYGMRFDFCNQFFCYRCIQTDICSQTFCLFTHSNYGFFHLCLSRSFSCCQKLSADFI